MVLRSGKFAGADCIAWSHNLTFTAKHKRAADHYAMLHARFGCVCCGLGALSCVITVDIIACAGAQVSWLEGHCIARIHSLIITAGQKHAADHYAMLHVCAVG